LTTSRFAAALVIGALLRAVALPLPGTLDVGSWKIWSYSATVHAVTGLYGVGGSPPERRLLDFHGAETTVDYPPLALYELGVVGRIYRAARHGSFPDDAALTPTIKAAAIAAEAGLVLMVFFVLERLSGLAAARWAATAIWLNPATIYDASVLGYLDPLFVLPAAAALICAVVGTPALAGALIAAAVLTKAQAIVIAPAVALALWTNGDRGRGMARLIAAATGGAVLAGLVIVPIAAAGAWSNMIGALKSLTRHDMLSANACNLWWIVGYVMRACYSLDLGVWTAFTMPTKILQISRVIELGYPNPRTIGAALTIIAFAWALWTARRGRDLAVAAAVTAFLVHSYATLSAQVHENHLFAAVPFLAIAAASRPWYRPPLVVVSAIFALNLNLFYGISEGVGYGFPRTLTIVDATVILAFVNCAALVWHARILKLECSTAAAPRPEPAPGSTPARVDRNRLSGSCT
jgi:hypothetical protein